MSRARALREEKKQLEEQLDSINKRLAQIERLEKPFEAVVFGYAGRFSTFFKSEAQARKKMEEYLSKTYFRNGLLYGVQLRVRDEKGKSTLIESHKKQERWNEPVEMEA